ncbi:MAG: hypothetical protein EBR28_10915, partial [Planctomycetia bacterium]|nr:hypothetical protein [Planctomycetia bacterium]
SPVVTEPLPPRPAEAHALEVARGLEGTRIVCTTAGRGQAASGLAGERPTAAVTGWFLDLHQHDRALEAWAGHPAGLSAVCTADMPPGPYDLAVVPLAKDGEAELARDILQAALVNLAMGGRLVAAIDNPRDTWLHGQLAATGETVRVRPAAGGKPATICYVVEKTREPAKLRDFTCEFAFRDRERLLRAVSRPGVFAHRRIDPGARHLINAVDVAPGTRVVDVGCGSGCVAIAIAARDPSVHVHALDSAARAVECTARGAEANGLANVSVVLEAGGLVPDPGSYRPRPREPAVLLRLPHRAVVRRRGLEGARPRRHAAGGHQAAGMVSRATAPDVEGRRPGDREDVPPHRGSATRVGRADRCSAFTWTTFAGGKPLKWVLEAAE